MKRSLVAVALVLLSLNLKAQTFEESMRYWSDGPLVWDDLTLKSPRDFRTCELSFRWMAQEEKTCPAWNTNQYVTVPSVALDKSISWHNMDRMYPFALTYDQVLFDLNELYFRKMLTELYSKGNQRSSNALYSFYTEQSASRWREIQEDTQDGMDSTMVAYYAQQVAEELAQASYPKMNKDRRRFLLGYNLGYGYNQFFGEAANTFSPTHGVYLDMVFGYRQHELGLMLTVGTGTMLQDFHYEGNLWQTGRKVNHGYVGLTYGFRVYDGTFFYAKPFIGVAGRTLALLKEANQDKEKDYGSTVALGGAEFHFKFARTIRSVGGFENSLGLRVFVARDFGLLQATSLHVGLVYNIEMVDYD